LNDAAEAANTYIIRDHIVDALPADHPHAFLAAALAQVDTAADVVGWSHRNGAGEGGDRRINALEWSAFADVVVNSSRSDAYFDEPDLFWPEVTRLAELHAPDALRQARLAFSGGKGEKRGQGRALMIRNEEHLLCRLMQASEPSHSLAPH
jgi:hypothetical protein